jgi:dephospho-CoA kinase
MMVIGLTGGIAAGKSTVARMLQNSNIPVIDADLLAREVTLKNSMGLRKVVAAFGEQFLDSSGELDRKALAAVVFSDHEKLKLLEEIVHPLIEEEKRKALSALEKSHASVVVYMAPLLFEKNIDQDLDKTLLVTCSDDVRIKRIMNRDQLGEAEARQRISKQWSDEKKAQKASEILENNGNLDSLQNNLRVIWRRMTGMDLVAGEN